jgi:hypothetical protein
MNNEENLNIPQPDPSWDYYIEWHKLIKANAQLKELIEFMSKVENATEDAQEILQQDILKILATLKDIQPPDESQLRLPPARETRSR